MRNSLRTFLVGLMIVAVSFYPAAAWQWCGGCGSYGPAYYGPVYDDGCCGEVVVMDDYCGGYEPCGCDGAVVEGAPSEPMYEPTPAPPATAPPTLPPRQPGKVQRPVEVAPAPVQPTPPAEEPDALFNGLEEAAPPEQKEPAAELPMEEPPAEEPEDIFGQPAETTPPAEEPAEEPVDLFGEPAETEPEMPVETEETPAEEQPAEEPATEEVDDIFGASRSVLHEAGGLASDQMRVWIDNTGSYSTRGRLISLLDGHVQLLKDNGRISTVPLSRLSPSDLEFVHRQAGARQVSAYQTVQSLPAMPELAN